MAKCRRDRLGRGSDWNYCGGGQPRRGRRDGRRTGNAAQSLCSMCFSDLFILFFCNSLSLAMHTAVIYSKQSSVRTKEIFFTSPFLCHGGASSKREKALVCAPQAGRERRKFGAKNPSGSSTWNVYRVHYCGTLIDLRLICRRTNCSTVFLA